MPDVQEILKNVGSKIGRTEIDPSNPGQLDDLKSEITSKKISEFEESLRVEGVKSTVDKDKNSPTYQRLDPQIAKSIDIFFRGITQEEFNKYAEQEGNQGKSSNGEPFKCYAEIIPVSALKKDNTKFVLYSKYADSTETNLQFCGGCK